MDEISGKPAADRFAGYDNDPDHPVPDAVERPGSEWGIASLVAGGMLGIGALVFLVLAVTTLAIGHRFSRFDVGIITALHVLLTVAVVPINLLSVIGGLKGIFAARGRGQPIAYGLMGFALSVLAFGLWVCACVAGFAVLSSV